MILNEGMKTVYINRVHEEVILAKLFISEGENKTTKIGLGSWEFDLTDRHFN